ncbi:hypothetical protein GCM10011575_31480 [Microlunatus endophyticus]|uniref:Lipopolysaccharide assembly protein A domain-containing protein n=1 Tax=Microlunatus endophyticus TaxID=1716077 RepID=A0A917W6R1_9ACTN|nr:LapA family protein [Microlunatus endophyticus]GGL70691.1 hypothetical protein GCM10011575_31480 [Microlunatus endophyticus]
MTSDKPEDAATTEETPGAAGSDLEPAEGRTVGQGVEPVAPDKPTDSTGRPGTPAKKAPEVRKQTRISAAFVALAVGIIVLVLLLIFILQNNETTTVRYFGAQGHMPLGVLLLFSAAGGALIVVIFGAARIAQLHWLARRDRRTTGARKKP